MTLLLFNHQLTRPFFSAKRSAKESSGLGATPVLSVTEFIHGEAKVEVNKQIGTLSVYLHELFFFLFSSNIATCLLVIVKAYQLSNLETNHSSIQIPCKNCFFAVNYSLIQLTAKLKRSQQESLEQWYLLRSSLILEMQPLLPRLTCH